MKTLGRLLGSAARTDILRVLSRATTPIGLRHIARLADVYPRSAQLALDALVREALVTRTRVGQRRLYAVNQDHPDVPVLRAVFAAAELAGIRARNRAIQDRARKILPAIRDATRLLRNTRSMRDAT